MASLNRVDKTQLAITDEEYLYKRTYGRALSQELFDSARPDDYLTVLGMEIKGKREMEHRWTGSNCGSL